MNTIYRIVWSTVTGRWVVTSELAKGHKRSAVKTAAAAAALVLGMGSQLGFAAENGSELSDPAIPGVSCTTQDGQAGTTNIAGECLVDLPQGPEPVNQKAITPRAALDDGFIKVNKLSAGTSNPAIATGSGSMAIGDGAQSGGASAYDAIAIGVVAKGTGNASVALGRATEATGSEAVAIANTAKAAADYSLAMGKAASVDAASTGGIAIGRNASIAANASESIALGSDSTVSVANALSIGNDSLKRKLVNLASGAQANDGVNVSQLSPMVTALGGGAKIDALTGAVTGPTFNLANGGSKTTVADALISLDGAITTNAGSITSLTSQVNNINNGSAGLVQQDGTSFGLTVASGKGGGNFNFRGLDGDRVLSGVGNGANDDDAVTVAQLRAVGLVDPNGKPVAALTYDDLTLATARLGGSRGTVIRNLADGSIALGSMDAVNGGQLFALQQQVNSLGTDVSGIKQGIADGTIGGGSSPGTGDNSSASGTNAVASGSGATASGNNSAATGDNSTASGAGAQATGSNSTASGANAVASGSNSAAIGTNSSATGNNAVAMGANSVADRDNSVSVGSAGNERQITNVAAGTQRTDAANWGQAQDAVQGMQDWTNRKFEHIDRRISGMGAMSAAYSQMAFSAQGVDKENRLGVGVGTQGGQAAVAVGYSHRIAPNLNVSFGGSTSGRDTSVGAGMAFGW